MMRFTHDQRNRPPSQLGIAFLGLGVVTGGAFAALWAAERVSGWYYLVALPLFVTAFIALLWVRARALRLPGLWG